MTDKIRILLLASDSLDLFYMPYGDEQRSIENRIHTGSHSNHFEVIPRPPIKLLELGGELMRHEPHVVHISAEGRAGEGILLEDDERRARAIRAQEMASLIRDINGDIRLMFLNACYTEEHAKAISNEVDYVIGMRGEVEEMTAMAFARHFYQALGCGKTVEVAFNIATSEIKMAGYAGADLPVLYVKPGVDRSLPLTKPRAVHGPEVNEPDVVMRDLGDQFVTQLSIAGHFQDENHSQQAIYFDTDLYVHRKSEEIDLLNHVEKFVESSAPQGRWVSVIGDAGHGKSSLLWYIYESLKGHTRLRIVPFLAQLEGHWGRIETTALKLKRSLDGPLKLLVIIDTLDILVGIADPSLAAMLNLLRSAGCMLITTSRRQEAERLFIISPSDHQVELKRFNDDEAKQAIRNFVNLAYDHRDEEDRVRQRDKIWGILEQQRKVRELDLEPLILRMLFEAYVPDPIPRDVNTQQVYKRFWNKRVLRDRVVKNADERSAREQLCRLLARQVGFGGGHSDKLSVNLLQGVWKEAQAAPFPHTILEGLVSTGVLQWAEGVSTIRFFHQTFFEYAAAYDLLSSDESVIDSGIKTLLSEVRNFSLFRAPILKQFAIQAFENGNDRWKTVLQGLREINNELAAQMALEIVGKLPDDPFSAGLCREWIETNGAKLQNVICETVRHYPRSKTGVALGLLEPYLEGPKAKMIYSICAETFAKDAPAQVCEFLSRFLPKIKDAGDDEQKHYKEALCSALEYGAVEALGVLIDLFPHLKPGQQAGLLYKIAEAATSGNAERVAGFLKSVIDIMPQVKSAKQAEVWDGILKAACRLHEVSLATGRELGRWLIATGRWKENQTTAMYTGMIIGPTVSDPLIVHQAFSAISSDDHFTRLLNAGLLSYLPETFSADLMERILAVEKELYQSEAKMSSLFSVVAGLKGVDPRKILHFLEEWPWQDSGMGTPLRSIMGYLALADPLATKEWLFKQLALRKGPASFKLFSAFNILLQTNVEPFTPAEARRLYDTAFASPKPIREIFAGTTGSIARIDRQLAEEIFKRVFTSEGKECQVYAVNSLSSCLETCPEFVIDQAVQVLKTAISTHNLGILHSYLIVLRKLPHQHAGYLLQRMSDWFTREILQGLRDEKTFGELLTVLKINAKADPRFTFEFSKRVPIINKGVAGGLATVYDQISEHGDEESLLLELLESVAEVSKFNQVRISNALKRTLPQLDRKLGGRKVVGMVFRAYKNIKDEKALKTFIDAASRVASWTEEDTMKLLKDPDLPDSVRGLLAAKIKR